MKYEVTTTFYDDGRVKVSPVKIVSDDAESWHKFEGSQSICGEVFETAEEANAYYEHEQNTEGHII